MKTLKNSPELMTVIINIQTMEQKIYGREVTGFKKLKKMTEDQLDELQQSLIPEYNKAVKM